MMLHSVFGFSLTIGRKFIVARMLIFFQTVGFSHAIILAPLTWCFPNIAKSDYLSLSVSLFVCPSSLKNSLHNGKIFMKYEALEFL